jgi:hypothetical protein
MFRDNILRRYSFQEPPVNIHVGDEWECTCVHAMIMTWHAGIFGGTIKRSTDPSLGLRIRRNWFA